MPRFVALDVDFLIALSQGVSEAEGVQDWLERNGYFPLATSTVMQEFRDMIDHGNAEVRAAAEAVLRQMTNWNIWLPQLSPLKNGLAHELKGRLFREGILGEAAHTEGDGMVIAEAAGHRCSLLISYSLGRLPEANWEGLRRSLLAADHFDLLVLGPHVIVELMRREALEAVGSAPASASGAV